MIRFLVAQRLLNLQSLFADSSVRDKKALIISVSGKALFRAEKEALGNDPRGKTFPQEVDCGHNPPRCSAGGRVESENIGAGCRNVRKDLLK